MSIYASGPRLKLVPGMFGHEFNAKSPCFGIACGQMRMRGNGLNGHNAGWYNKHGEKIGWGDLNHKDAVRIAQEIAEDEMFIILGESDSFWHFVQRPGFIGSMAEVDHQSENNPGVEFVGEKAYAVIMKHRICFIVDSKRDYSPQPEIELLPRFNFQNMLRAAQYEGSDQSAAPNL